MRVAVIGGGPAGLMAAGTAGTYAETVLFERNEKTGKKLYITGKGRCNVTNTARGAEFLKNVVHNAKFLYGAIHAFDCEDTIRLLEGYGTETKIERGGRVFPVSDKSSDVLRALNAYCRSSGIRYCLNERVLTLEKDACFRITTEKQIYEADRVVLACGGRSYPVTGSTGDGYRLAAGFGHTIVPTRPALVPLLLEENVLPLQGLSLKNVALAAEVGGKTYREFGEMLFTANGVSGPIALTMSSYLPDAEGIVLHLDLKPALCTQELDARVLSDFHKYGNKRFKNALDDLLPKSLIPYTIARSGIDAEKQVNVVTKEERNTLVGLLKDLTFTVSAKDGLDRAIVTAGGVDVKEVNPKTMESKLVEGLYFAGEMLDVDALTGGFNIQIALSTGYLAGRAGGL